MDRRNGGGLSLLDNIINHTPFELHFPGYQFLGPGTHVEERLERGERGINPLDNACLEHDIAYSCPDIDRTKADRRLAQRAFSRMLSETAERDEKTVAFITVCCMVGKIALDRLCSRVKKVIKRTRKSLKKSVSRKKSNGEDA